VLRDEADYNNVEYCVLDIRNSASQVSLVKRHCMQQAVRMFFLLLLENHINAFVDILCAFNLKGWGQLDS